MNKQEAIEKVKTMTVETFFSGTLFVKQQEVIAIIEQIGEPEKPVIPQFVASWIEIYKKQGKTLYMAMDAVHYSNHPCRDWFESNQETFARAWLDGYEVEKEKLYTARLKLVTQNKEGYLNRNCKDNDFFIDDLRVFSGEYQTSFTRSELEELNVWDNPAFEIEEVE